MRILLIAYAFPPFPASGALRAEKVARTFQRARHDVRVITSRLPGEDSGPRVDEAGLLVRTVPCWPNPRHLLVGMKRRTARSRASPEAVDDEATFLGKHPADQKWKRRILSLLWLPDDLQGFIVPALYTAVRMMAREPADLAYTTSPPASDHLAGLLLKRLTGIRWAVEFRDPWVHAHAKPLEVRSQAIDRLETWLEQCTLRSADHIIAASEGIGSLLAARAGPRGSHKITIVLNGIEKMAPAAPALPAPEHPFRILHLGALYNGRDPRPFLSGLALLKREGVVDADHFELHFVGVGRTYGQISVEKFAHDLGISDVVQFRDWIPHAEAQAAIEAADLLLLFAQHQPQQVPNKLYEYLGARKPILALADDEGETAHMLRRVGGHYLVHGSDPKVIAQALRSAILQRDVQDRQADETALREWQTSQQMERLCRALTFAPAPETIRQHRRDGDTAAPESASLAVDSPAGVVARSAAIDEIP